MKTFVRGCLWCISLAICLSVFTAAQVAPAAGAPAKNKAVKPEAVAKAPTPVPVNATLVVTSDVEEGVTLISGNVQGLQDKASTFNVEAMITPPSGATYPAPLTLADKTVTEVPVNADESFKLTLVNPLPAGAAIEVKLVAPAGVTLADAKKATWSKTLSLSLKAPTLQVTTPPAAGKQTIAGTVTPMPTPAETPVPNATPPYLGNLPQIAVWIHEKAAAAGIWYQAPLSPSANNNETTLLIPVDTKGNFNVQLSSPLQGDESVVVEVLPPTGHSFDPGHISFEESKFDTGHLALSASLFQLQPVLKLVKPTISTVLHYGLTALTGDATPTSASGIAVNVAIVRVSSSKQSDKNGQPTGKDDQQTGGSTQQAANNNPGPSPCMNMDDLDPTIMDRSARVLPLTGSNSANSLYVATDSNGHFTANLAEALNEGETIQVVQILPQGVQPAIADYGKCASVRLEVPSAFTFYRTNVTFAAGLVISNNSSGSVASSNFSQANQFYALNLDRAWKLPGTDCATLSAAGKDQEKCGCKDAPKDEWKGSGFPGINSFFETRLTAIPVSSNAATPLASSGANSGTGSTSSSTSTSSILTSQKVVRVMGGIYLPWMLVHGHGDHPSGLFLAPVGKVGFDTLTGSGQTTVPLSGNGSSASTNTLYYQTAYNFYNYGLRIGEMKISGSKSKAPLIDNYLDITWGRYSSLPSAICKTSTVQEPLSSASQCLADYPKLYTTGANPLYPVDTLKRLYRIDIEGLVRIPVPATAIPFYIGMNANIGQHGIGTSLLDRGFSTPDDIRIFFGTKFDVGNLLSTLNLGPH